MKEQISNENPKGSQIGSPGLRESNERHPGLHRRSAHPEGVPEPVLSRPGPSGHSDGSGTPFGVRTPRVNDPGVSFRHAPFNPRLPLCEPFGFKKDNAEAHENKLRRPLIEPSGFIPCDARQREAVLARALENFISDFGFRISNFLEGPSQ